MENKEIKLKDSSGKEFVITLQRINWVKANRIIDEVTSINALGKPNMKIGEYKIKELLAGILKAPFNITEQGLEQLEPKFVEKIYQEVLIMNTLTDKKKIPSGKSSVPNTKSESLM